MIDALDTTGQRQRTIVIFTSDNGSFPSWRPSGKYPGKHPACPRLGSNLPLRGYKAQLYEGGIRAPTAINWAGRLKPGKVTAVMHVADWMPTLTKLAGYKPARDLNWDGMDVWPLIAGKVTRPPARTIYWKFGGAFAIRHGDWKLIVRGRGRTELFHLTEYPCEKANLAARHPARVAELKKLLAEARKLDVAKRPKDLTAPPKEQQS